jgi:hypothetical protein
MSEKVLGALIRATARHCAAFFYAASFADIYFRKKGDDYIKEQGTITFVEYGCECYAITNQHVISDNWENRVGRESLLVALNRHLFWGISPIFVSPSSDKQNVMYPPALPRDIAVYPFSANRDRLIAANKEPIKLRQTMPEVSVDDIVLAVGFSGDERVVISETTAGHGLVHVFGTVRSISESKIIIQDNNPQRESNISFGGMSGGPIFKIDEITGACDLIGIIYEGEGNRKINSSEAIEYTDEVWVFGSPLDGNRLSEMIEMGR